MQCSRKFEAKAHRAIQKFHRHGEWYDLSRAGVNAFIYWAERQAPKHDEWAGLLTVKEAARRCNVSERKMYRAVHRGKVAATVLPGRRLAIREASLLPEFVQ